MVAPVASIESAIQTDFKVGEYSGHSQKSVFFAYGETAGGRGVPQSFVENTAKKHHYSRWVAVLALV